MGPDRRLAAVLIACAALACASPAPAQRNRVDPPVRIAVEARPIASFEVADPDQRRFGMLEYIGGSSSPRRTGISAAFRRSASNRTASISSP
jgi:hypothetical protein